MGDRWSNPPILLYVSFIFISVEDIYEIEGLERDSGLDPHKWADRQFNEIYRRNWKMYLNSIEWDTWCTRHEPTQDVPKKPEHPFEKFF